MTNPVAAVAPEDEQPSGAFNPDDYEWPSHLKRALDELVAKKIDIDRCWRYYDNEHPKVWMTDAIKDKLDDQLIAEMAENWCDVAVDGPIKRLLVEGFVDRGKKEGNPREGSDEVANPIMSDAAKNVWKDNDMRLGQKDVYTHAGVAGEAFVFAWKADGDPDTDPTAKESGVDWTLKDARNVWWPADAHRNDPSRVVLIWADEDEGVWRATCYYKYVVVRLVGPKLKNIIDEMPQARWFKVDPDDPGGEHGFDKVPVVRFAERSKRISIVNRIRSFQDKINKLAANLLVTAEFNAWRKMAILTEQTIDDDTLKFRPNRVAVLDPGGGENGAAPTSIWEGEATDLANYSNEQDKLIDKLFTKAYLPGHMKVKSEKTLPSGAAYQADEGPFTEYVGDLQASYGESWHDLQALSLGVDVECQWRDAHVRSDADEATTVKSMVDAGMPLSLALKYYAGWTNDQIAELENAPLSPQEQLKMSAAEALANGDVPPGNPNAQPGGQVPKPPNQQPAKKAVAGKPLS